MSTFAVALLQLRSQGDDTNNAATVGEAACREAASLDADIALFPEMWRIGYTPCPSDRVGSDEWRRLATTAQGEFVTGFRHLANELDMAIAITYLEEWNDKPRNTVSIIDRKGEIVLTYAKVHTCDFGMEAALTPGDRFEVATLETRTGDVQIGSMICYDREFPESARVLMRKGAEVILVPNACELEENRRAQIRTRAFENMTAIAVANYADHGGRSVAYSGVAFDENGQGLDHLVVDGGKEEGAVIARFDMDELRHYRNRETWGDAYRKPRAYGGLSDHEVLPVFKRTDARR